MDEIKIESFQVNKWSYLNYTKEEDKLLNLTSFIEYRPGHDDFQVTFTFPFLNEEGIDNKIKELKFAKQAIKELKRKRINKYYEK